MILKKLKNWNTHPSDAVSGSSYTGSLSPTSTTKTVAEMAQQIGSKDKEINNLNNKITELTEQLERSARKQSFDNDSCGSSVMTSSFPVERSSLINEPTSLQNRRTSTSTDRSFKGVESIIGSNTDNLHRTYEEANFQLLEKLKLKESENQILVTRISQLTERVSDLEDELFIVKNHLPNNSNLEEKEQGEEEEKEEEEEDEQEEHHHEHEESYASKQDISISEEIKMMSTAILCPPPQVDNDVNQDAASFINGLFDAISLDNNELELGCEPSTSDISDDKHLVSKISSASLNSAESTADTSISSSEKEMSNCRNSCDSLLSLNKSAIKVDSINEPIKPYMKTNLRSKSPSTRSLKNFSKRRVHQISSYLNPSKDNIPIPSSPATINSQVSSRSSLYNEDSDAHTIPSTPVTPLTPQSVNFSDFPDPKLSNYFGGITAIKHSYSTPSLTNSVSSTAINSNVCSKKLNFANEYVTEAFVKRIPQPATAKRMKSESNIHRCLSPVSMEIIREN
ncbi:hypothetical protein DASC09_000930 [Saccharomycopsis crataegensis]|uniref:Uncharacterized protein n=1 Tax=Saccharomycopsis crataegensis TaxID=43959 RepID=A0AAV5QDE6_9ASCO|nr:hypothetical protein DASC09_000930 [Saccharomycopsis crataegensis]